MTASPLALGHLRVVELCDGLAGAFCGKQFRQWGATVTVVEPADWSLRTEPPFDPRTGLSLTAEFLLEGKHVGPAVDAAEIAAGDVLITDWSPARFRETFGFDLEASADRWPALVVVSLTPFGLSGPYRDLPAADLTVDAMSGFTTLNGAEDRAPLRAPGNILAYSGGANAFVGALAALHERNRSGRGQLVEVALVEAAASHVPFLRTEYSGEPHRRAGGPGSGTTMYHCADGYLSVNPAAERSWLDLLVRLGIAEDEVPEALRTARGRADGDAMAVFLAPVFAGWKVEELFRALADVRIVSGVYREPPELLSNPHLLAREFFHQVEHPVLGPVVHPGPPAKLSRTPASPPGKDLAAPGQHSAPLPGDGPRSRPLEGLRILDVTQAWIGPHASLLLADLGADVVKVESVRHPDVWRNILSGPLIPGDGTSPAPNRLNISALFNATNRNKRSLVLELDTPGGRELFLRLLPRFDIVMENFTPRVMGNFDLHYDVLAAHHPAVIFASWSGFGATGPYRDFRANGATTETHSGWDAVFGYPGSPPMMMGAMQADAITGVQMAACVLVALLHRDRTGESQCIEGSMFEAAQNYIGEHVLYASLTGEPVPKLGNAHPSMIPHGVYRCAGEDEWLAIAARDDAGFVRLAAVINDPELCVPALDTLEGRIAARDAIDEAVAAWAAAGPSRERAEQLWKAGVPAGPVLHTDEVPLDPHFDARSWFQPMDHPDRGRHRYNGFPWRFSAAKVFALSPPPRLGEDGDNILRAEAGLSGDEIAALRETGITGDALVAPG